MTRKDIEHLKKHGYNDDNIKVGLRKIGSLYCIEHWLFKGFNEEDAKNKISTLQKENSPRCIEHWIRKGFNEEDAKKLVSESQDKVSIKSLIKRGDDVNKHTDYCRNRKITKEKYIELYGEEAGNEKYLNKVKGSIKTLESLTNKYGEKIGVEKWNKYIVQQKKSNSYDGLLKNHGEKKANEIHNLRKRLYELNIEKNIKNGILPKNFYSKISQELFFFIYNNILVSELKDDCYFFELNKEYLLYDDSIKRYYLYDFVISKLNLCIEFNGDIWHANPNKYNENDIIPLINKTAKEIWYKDEIKIQKLKHLRNIDTIVVWESDWKNNKESVINIIRTEILKRY